MYHPLQELSKGERVVIVGTGETAAIAFEYFRHDTPHEVVAFSAEAPFITSEDYYGLPVVPLEELAIAYPAAGTARSWRCRLCSSTASDGVCTIPSRQPDSRAFHT